MNANDVGTAITQALIQGGSKWLISTIVAFLPALWTLTLMLHLGRPYVLRTLRKCGLRLGADVWWMSYLLIRDGLIIVTFGLSWIFFQPNIVTSVALPMTGSLAAVCLLLALATKLTSRMDDNVNAYRLTTVFLVLGATLYYGPQVFAVEATSQVHLSGFAQAFTTTANVNLALALTWISLAAVTGVLGWLFVRASTFASRKLTERAKSPAPSVSRSPMPTA